MPLFRFKSEMLEATTEWWLAQCATLARQWFTANKPMLFVILKHLLKTASNTFRNPKLLNLPRTQRVQCVGRLTMYGKTSHVREVFPYMGSFPMHGNSSHRWEVFPSAGRLPNVPIYVKSSHTPEFLKYRHLKLSTYTTTNNLGLVPVTGMRHRPSSKKTNENWRLPKPNSLVFADAKPCSWR